MRDIIYPAVAPGSNARLRLRYDYNESTGDLATVTNLGTGTALWTALDRDPLGRLRSERYGNGVVSSRTYWPVTGRLRTLQTGPSAELQNLSFSYSSDGHLIGRRDFNTRLGDRPDFWEGFSYDRLGRLETWYQKNTDADGPPTASGDTRWRVSYAYDDRGNLTSRDFVSPTLRETITQTYGQTTSEAYRLKSTTLWSGTGADDFLYDGIGNVERHPRLGTIEHTPFNLPRMVRGTAATATHPAVPGVQFTYDAFERRVTKRALDGQDLTVYAGDLYERRGTTDPVAIMHVFAEGKLVAQISETARTRQETKYVYTDDTDSPAAIQSPTAISHLKRDPFGNPLTLDPARRISTLALSASRTDPPLPSTVTKDFTGHELDGDLGAINMGGRIYDPRLARFLQPDPFVTAPFFTQSHNRYAYVWNNPIAHRDPTGFQIVCYEGTPCGPTPAAANITYVQGQGSSMPIGGGGGNDGKSDVDFLLHHPQLNPPHQGPVDAPTIVGEPGKPPGPHVPVPAPSQGATPRSEDSGIGSGWLSALEVIGKGQLAMAEARASVAFWHAGAAVSVFGLSLLADLAAPGSGVAARGALTAVGGMVAYRIITSNAGANFTSNAARGLAPRGPEIGNALLHKGLSIFDSLAGAASRVPTIAHALARQGQSVLGIAELRLSPALGAQTVKTLGEGHWTFTGDGLLLQSVWFQTFPRALGGF